MIASVGNAAALAFESALAAEDLHPRHFAVLRGLRDGEEHTQQQLASSLGIPASRLVGLLSLPAAPTPATQRRLAAPPEPGGA
ncbi:hypothetical protein [Streptomyces orinoci]|uniref:Transcriptional regulator n=1 Tax=Streptomyces orinoci TaxID=67339 RepID=A0ABV3K0T7_STRON|nr:hypothetical protein [Streptomyces orinoci]